MTLAEIMKAQNIGDDIIKAVQDAMKENKIFLTGEENLDVRYNKLKGQHSDISTQLSEAQKRIKELEAAGGDSAEMVKKNEELEKTIASLQAQLTQQKIESKVQIGLRDEKVIDPEYAAFLLTKDGDLELDDKEQIKGWADKITALKTSKPSIFESAGGKKYQEHRLKDGDGGEGSEEPKSLADALQMKYENDE